jgi:hypothetical protein
MASPTVLYSNIMLEETVSGCQLKPTPQASRTRHHDKALQMSDSFHIVAMRPVTKWVVRINATQASCKLPRLLCCAPRTLQCVPAAVCAAINIMLLGKQAAYYATHAATPMIGLDNLLPDEAAPDPGSLCQLTATCTGAPQAYDNLAPACTAL